MTQTKTPFEKKFFFAKGFFRRFFILLLVYATFLIPVLLTMGQFFNAETVDAWVLWIILGASLIGFIALWVVVEVEQWKRVR